MAAVRAMPTASWVFRRDKESDRTCTVREDTPEFPTALVSELIDGAVAAAGLPPGYANRMVLSCVPAGEEILPHTDDFGEVVRSRSIHCHIPLITDQAAIIGFPARGWIVHLQAGHLYSIDETELHFVRNPSRSDRVHLLFAHFPHDGRGRASL